MSEVEVNPRGKSASQVPAGRSLTRVEAQERATHLSEIRYAVALDLDRGTHSYGSASTIDFHSDGAETFLDVRAAEIHTLTLNGEPLAPSAIVAGRLPLRPCVGHNTLFVDATMLFRRDGEGLHRATDPADGRDYVYAMSFMDAAPTIFACFDQPDLKAPVRLTVRAPEDWTVIANSPGHATSAGHWEFQESPPLSTYFITLVAGPYTVVHDEHDGIPLSISARASLEKELRKQSPEIFALTKQCFDEFHRLFGVRYPFGNYHQAFVPEFNAGAMENPGCVTFRDPLIFTSRPTHTQSLQRATTIAHEMAHQWFGNLTTPRWWDDLWLNESFAEYMGTRVTADVTEYVDAWVNTALVRLPWGLGADQAPTTHPVAGNGAPDAQQALQSFDGISYAKGSAILKQLATRVGDVTFFAGVRDHFERHRFGNATMTDLFESWRRAGVRDIEAWSAAWLLTQGVDTVRFDRDEGVVALDSPDDGAPTRAHATALGWYADGHWNTQPIQITEARTPAALVPVDAAVVLDPDAATWAVCLSDEITTRQLPAALPAITDPMHRTAAWNAVRNSFHDAVLAPDLIVDVARQCLGGEADDDIFGQTASWLVHQVAPHASDPAQSTQRLHDVFADQLHLARPASLRQLTSLHLWLDTCQQPELLRGLLSGDVPIGITVDSDLRWSVLTRLAALGATEIVELDRELAAETTSRASIAYVGARTSLPLPESKAWGWAAVSGARPVSNYELEAAGKALWRYGQEEYSAPYVARYFDLLDRLPDIHRGWVLADATTHFFPHTDVAVATLTRAQAASLDQNLHPVVRRNVAEAADILQRRHAVRQRNG